MDDGLDIDEVHSSCPETKPLPQSTEKNKEWQLSNKPPLQTYRLDLSAKYAYWDIQLYTKTLASSSTRDVSSLLDSEINKTAGLAQRISNFVSIQEQRRKLKQNCTVIDDILPPSKTATDKHIRREFEIQYETARLDMEVIAKRRLFRIANESKIPLIQRRSHADYESFLEENVHTQQIDINICAGLDAGSSASSRVGEAELMQGLYTDNDVFEVLKGMRTNAIVGNGSFESESLSQFWSTFKSPFQSVSLEEFRIQFRELSPSFRHFGMDDGADVFDSATDFTSNFTKIYSKVDEARNVKLARLCSRQGLPAHLRGSMWDLMVQSDMTQDVGSYAREQCVPIKAQIAKYSLLTDRLILSDVNAWCKNDDAFFVFEDMLRSVLLLWSRDEWVLKNSPNASAGLSGDVGDRAGKKELKICGKWGIPVKAYPPNGVYPFSGLSCYAMIVSFLHSELDMVYMTFRELYARYFHHLHTISCHPQSLPNLLVTFESLLKALDPLLYLHLTQHVGTAPVSFAFRWIMYGFVGVLDVEQTLLLWDRILGFDKMELLSAVAAALFCFRRERLFCAQTEKDVNVSCDSRVLAMVKVIPLLQHYYFVYGTDDDNLPKEWRMFVTSRSGGDDDVDSD